MHSGVAHRIPLYRTGIFRPARSLADPPSATMSAAMASNPLSWPRKRSPPAPSRSTSTPRRCGWRAAFNEPVTLSQGRYGPVEAVPRILGALRAASIRASFFIPAWVASTLPGDGEGHRGGGHEIGCHGDEHERVSDLPPEREEAILVSSVEVLTRGDGPPSRRAIARPRGRSLRARCRYWSVRLRLLVEHHGPPVAVPAPADRGAARSWRSPCPGCSTTRPTSCSPGSGAIQAPGPVLQGWITEFDGIREVHGVTNFTFHPQIIGRPSRLACLRELIDHVRHTPRVWIAPLGEIAAHCAQRGALAQARAPPP